MPETITMGVRIKTKNILYPFEKRPVEVATEGELLEFANKVRAAGGANILEALLPSHLGDARRCLIANALNFSCSVMTYGEWEDFPNEPRWAMCLPHNMDRENAEKIAKAVYCKLVVNGDRLGEMYFILLPRHIGNAARAFDHGLAFTNFIIDPNQESN